VADGEKENADSLAAVIFSYKRSPILQTPRKNDGRKLCCLRPSNKNLKFGG
jgi:hypothetical protein